MSLVLFRSLFDTTIIISLLLLSISVGFAQVRTSPSYQLQSDSVNVGGGVASSPSYQGDSTVGEIATGPSASDNFALGAGFQQMQVAFISLSVVDSVVLTPDLPGITGGTSTASTTVTVTTDSPGGYQLSIVASQDPAMQSPSDTIEDYVPLGSEPDFSFLVTPAAARFGFSPSGPDRAARFASSGGVCGVGSADIPQTCWDGLGTTSQVIAVGSGGNQPTGTPTTIYFQVGIGSGAVVPPGSYVATTTLSVLAL